jgi:L-2,4-diaminobutyrate decarboxylase
MRRSRQLIDPAFVADGEALGQALALLLARGQIGDKAVLPMSLPDTGIGEAATLRQLAPLILGGAQRLDGALAMAHMDPPTPWITWATTLWNASLNQNLLHPDTAPVARDLEVLVVNWLAPLFGMNGGHLVPGSTVANLTGIWAARDAAGAEEVVASRAAHLSVEKAAKLLGMRYRPVETDVLGRLQANALGDLKRACLVLTAGTTSVGAVDPLDTIGQAAWTHVDAAWAGPLRLSERHAEVLAGIERADSVAISAHKWLFQPKESALILFRETSRANKAISFGGAYLTVPNVGLLGSHGATAVPLLATLLAFGRRGVAARIERCLTQMREFAGHITEQGGIELFAASVTGVLAWRSSRVPTERLHEALPAGSTSITTIRGEKWLRNVAANPNADPLALAEQVRGAIQRLAR